MLDEFTVTILTALTSPQVNNSGLVVDPVSDEKLRKLCNLWSEEEKQVFLEKLADFAVRSEKEGLRKNFYKISHYRE